MSTRILVVDDSPTLRRVVVSILERHGYVAVPAVDGQDAIEIHGAASPPFDLVLLDFIMPRMNGFQFCRELRQRGATTPVVLMSAKSDKIREQFVQQTGAIDALSKPFDAQALLAVIENTIRRSETWRSRGQALAAGIPDEFEVLTESRGSTTGDQEARRILAAHELVRAVSATVSPVVARIGADAINESRLATELSAHVPVDKLLGMVETVRELNKPAALAGDLAIIPIGAVLQLLQIESQTGSLNIRGASGEITISMREGLIDLVQARNAAREFRLGRYFVEHGLLKPEDIDALLRDQGSPKPPSDPPPRRSSPPPPSSGTREGRDTKLIGDILVDAGRVTREDVAEALARQSSELIYDVLRWHKGRFEFRREPAPLLAASARLGLPVASVVMEGFRRVDEWRVIEAGLGSFDGVLLRDEVSISTADIERLTKPERVILDAIDGERTVREIIQASHMSSFDACKVVYQLLEARLVRRRAA